MKSFRGHLLKVSIGNDSTDINLKIFTDDNPYSHTVENLKKLSTSVRGDYMTLNIVIM